MAGGVKGIPDGSSVVMPRLFCRDVVAAIDFCKDTFGAVELGRRPGPNGTVAHALLTIGPAMIMIDAEWPGVPTRAPDLDGSSPVVIYDGSYSARKQAGMLLATPATDPETRRPLI